jgi:hypothetical protein
MNIFDCRDFWATPIVREITFDWRDFVPLAKTEASKFYWRQERGRFRFEDLLSTAIVALATSKGVNHAIKCINGALRDHARDGDKLVRDVEMTEKDWRRTRGGPPEPRPPADAPLLEYVENDLKIMVWPMGLRRLKPRGDGVATSKHGKVSVAIGSTTFNDGWSQQDHGWVRAKVDADFQDRPEEGLKLRVRRAEESGYTGAGTAKLWSKSCLSSGDNRNIAGVVHKSGLTPEGWRRFKLVKRDGKTVSGYRGPVAPALIRRFESPKLTPAEAAIRSGRRTSVVRVDMTRFGLDPGRKFGLKRKLGRELAIVEGPKITGIGWHQEAGYVQVDSEVWGLPAFGVFCHPVEDILLRPDQEPWRRGIHIFEAEGPMLDRAVEHFWKNTVARWISKKSRRKLFSPGVINSRVWGDVIGRGAPSRPCSAPLALGGSRAGGVTLVAA